MIATLLAIAAVAGPANRRGVSAAVYRALEGRAPFLISGMGRKAAAAPPVPCEPLTYT